MIFSRKEVQSRRAGAQLKVEYSRKTFGYQVRHNFCTIRRNAACLSIGLPAIFSSHLIAPLSSPWCILRSRRIEEVSCIYTLYSICRKPVHVNDETDYCKIAFIHPLTPPRLLSLARCLVKPLMHALIGKDTRFAELIQSKGPGHRFIVLPLSILRGSHLVARNFAT